MNGVNTQDKQRMAWNNIEIKKGSRT